MKNRIAFSLAPLLTSLRDIYSIKNQSVHSTFNFREAYEYPKNPSCDLNAPRLQISRQLFLEHLHNESVVP